MAIVFYALMYVPAALCGIGYLHPGWLFVSLLAAWFWSIWLNSAKGQIDYAQEDTKGFMAKEREIKKGTAVRLLTIAAVFGIAHLFR